MVGSSMKGSIFAVLGSGINSMSEALIPFQPAIEEPSKAWPSVNLLLSNADTGTVTCCSLPLVSVKRKSTNFTLLLLIFFITSDTPAILKLLNKLNSDKKIVEEE